VSIVAFTALFALAAQHVVKAASGRTATLQKSRLSATTTSTKFFDEKSLAFSFGTDPGLGAPAAPQGQSAPAPVAQSRVS
jgi:hypothetical protein